MQSPTWAKSLVHNLVLAALYLIAARLGFLAAPAHHVVSSAWPPAGLALAALVLRGPHLWPGVALGALIANLTNNVALPSALAIAAGNTLEAIAGVWVLRLAAFRPAMDRLRDVLALSLVALTVPVISATMGVATLWLAGSASVSSLSQLWLAWWTGDAIGIVVVAPLPLTWGATGGSLRRASGLWLVEPIMLVLVLAALTGLLFATDFQYVYPIFPIAVLAAYRLGPRGAAVANVTVASVAVWFTMRGMGSFVVAPTTGTQNLFLFQVFIALLTITTLASAAVLAEQHRAEADLRVSQARLAEAQSVAQLGSWHWEANTNRLEWSDELLRIYGLDRAHFTPTLEGFLDRLHPDDRERVAGTIGKAIQELGSFRFDERIVRPDGEVRVLESRGQVVPGNRGRGPVLIGICQDVTDARRSQRTLAASEARFATMFHASPVAICVIDLEQLQIIDANTRFLEMLGQSGRDAVMGVSPRDLGMWSDPGELRDVVARLRRQRSVRETPVKYQTREGQERRALAALELVDIDGQESALVLVWRP